MNKRVALVTGGTGGIGTAICKALYNSGVTVVASYYKNGAHKAAQQWKEQLSAAGYDIHINYANVMEFQDCESLVRQIEEQLGSVDIVVNNAGITADSSLKKMTSTQWSSVMQANLDSVFNITRNAINGMLQNNFGRIINISSINGQKGQFGQCNYAAAKAGMYGFTKSLALEVANKGITVNSISPGYIQTEMLSGVSQDVLQHIIAQIPVGRLGQPEEIARVVAFLAADESSFITGADFAINGGQYM